MWKGQRGKKDEGRKGMGTGKMTGPGKENNRTGWGNGVKRLEREGKKGKCEGMVRKREEVT